MLDETTLKGVRKRNQKAFKELYECSIAYVFSIVKRYVRNESDYQDVIQDIYARVFLSIDSFDESKGEFKFWLRRLTVNQCIKHYHQQKSSYQMFPLETEAQNLAGANEESAEFSKEEIAVYLNQMPEGFKQVFMMVVLDGYSHKEVAEMLNISPVSSRSQLSRAKKWLKENLSKNKLNLLAGGI